MHPVSPLPNDSQAIDLKTKQGIDTLPAICGTRLNLIILSLICGILVLEETVIPKSCLGQEPRATPYRPTLSNPAQLPVPGYVEMEMGWQSLKEKATEWCYEASLVSFGKNVKYTKRRMSWTHDFWKDFLGKPSIGS